MNSQKLITSTSRVKHFLESNKIEYLSIYPYGSQVYGTMDDNSDLDFIVITNDQNEQMSTIIDNKVHEITFYTPQCWAMMIHDHHIAVLECVSLIHSEPIPWVVIPTLRSAISSKCSNSYVKAKKKMTVEKDYDLRCAKKSLFHSLRMYIFGIQIATKGYIYDFSAANDFYDEIMESRSCRWEDYHQDYRFIYNQLASEFRKVAPKGKP